jgi:hypothetical protein
MRIRIRNLLDPGVGIQDGKIWIGDKHPGSILRHCRNTVLKIQKCTTAKMHFELIFFVRG